MGKLLLSGLLASICLLAGCGRGGAIGGTGGGTGQPVLSSLQISPTNPSVAAGLTQKFTATGKFSDGSTRDMTATVTWTSSSPAIASINVSGTPGLAKGLVPGNSTISASSAGISGTTTLAVGNALLNSISVIPGNTTIPLGLQKQFSAAGTYSDGTTKNVTASVTWTSSNPNVLAITTGGNATTIAMGGCTVTAAAATGGVSGTANVTVGPVQLTAIAVTTTTPTVAAGSTAQFTATGTLSDGTTQDLTATATWSSSAQFIAPAPVQGLTQTQTGGTAIISAASGGVSGSTLLTATRSTAQPGFHIKLRGNSNPSPGTEHYSDVVAEGNFAYLATWHNTNGVWIFDISNPDAPKSVNHYAPAGISSNMQGIQVLHGIGYFAADTGNGGVHIVDLSNPKTPSLITQILPMQDGRWGNTVHDLTIDAAGKHLYIPGYPNDNSIFVYDVSNPAQPSLIRIFNGSDTFVHDVTVSGTRLFASGWHGTSDIFDISNVDTQAPTLLGTFVSGLHTQDVSVSTDGNFLFCPHEDTSADVAVFDITDPKNVTQVNDLREPVLGIQATSPSTSKIMGNFLYVAWYQAGLAVFDISDPKNPVLVGNYDTWPGSSTSGTGGGDGDWGIWPFQGTDRVLIGDRSTGLYVVDTRAVSSQPATFSLIFNPDPVVTSSSATTTGTVFLVGIAPSGGTTVTITTDNAGAPGQTLTIPAGAHSATFTQTVPVVSGNTTVNVTASDGIFQISTPLSLTP